VPPSTTSPGSPGSLSTAGAISKSNETHSVFQHFLRKSYENMLGSASCRERVCNPV
jgi:hypothetical protein